MPTRATQAATAEIRNIMVVPRLPEIAQGPTALSMVKHGRTNERDPESPITPKFVKVKSYSESLM